ncbi:MAG: peptide ABC transporter substrate-binding protein [Clostridium sp.]
MKRIISVILMVMFIPIFASACIGKKNSSAEEDRKYLIYNLGVIPKDLSMMSNDEVRGHDLLLALFDGLVRENESGDVVPSLAEDYSVSSDGIEYIFNIRNDIYWSDGTPIKAQDFKDFFKWILNKETKNIYAEDLYFIYGAKEYRENNGDFEDVAISVKDDNNFIIRLNTPCSYFVNILTNPIYNLRREEDTTKLKDYYNDVLSSGPFKLKAVAEGGIIIEKNTKYYNSKHVKSDNIVMKTLDNSESALVEFEALWGTKGRPINGSNHFNDTSRNFTNGDSKIDFFIEPPINEIQRLKDLKMIETYDNLNSTNYMFNMNKNIFKNENLRKAIVYAFSKKDIIKELAENVAIETMSYIPPATNNGIGSDYGVKNSLGAEGNEELSKELFSRAKYDKEKYLKLYYTDSYLNRSIAEECKKDLKKVLDINIELVQYKAGELEEILDEGIYDIIQRDFQSGFDDAVDFLSNFSNNSDVNKCGYVNKEFDSAILELRTEIDPLKRKELIVSVEEILLNDAPMIPIYSSSNVLCRREYVEGVYITKLGNMNLDKAFKSNKDMKGTMP